MAVGFKNGTDGDLAVALNAMQSSAQSHSFIGINQQGQVTLLKTKGNADGHIIYVAVKPQIMKSNMLMIVNGC